MPYDVLSTYNKALRNIGERKLASLSENREPRRFLDDEWADAVMQCLSAGFFNFSIRTYQVTASTTIVPAFGYIYAFAKPTDWVRTFVIADNDAFQPDLRRYHDENSTWFTDINPIYARIVSNDPNYGLNMSLWTPGFVEYLAAYLAFLIAPRITRIGSAQVDELDKRQKAWLIKAASRDGMDLPPGEPNPGTWIMSRAPRGSVFPFPGNGPFPWSGN